MCTDKAYACRRMCFNKRALNITDLMSLNINIIIHYQTTHVYRTHPYYIFIIVTESDFMNGGKCAL